MEFHFVTRRIADYFIGEDVVFAKTRDLPASRFVEKKKTKKRLRDLSERVRGVPGLAGLTNEV